MEPLQIAIIGLGGFAGSHHSAVRGLEAEGKCRLICTCDPNPAAFEQQMRDWDFAGRGVRVFDNYVSMLDGCASELDAVTIATPVPLHSEMHRACVERGLPVYLEKPPTLHPDFNIYHCIVRDPNGYLIEIQRFLDPAWPAPMVAPEGGAYGAPAIPGRA